jgi:integrase
MHRGAKAPSPHDAVEVDEVSRGIRNAWKRPPKPKAPAIDAEVERLTDAVEPEPSQGMRDRALVLLGFAAAFRRSELVALDVEQLGEQPEGFLVRIASSKMDQAGEGQTIAIARVPNSPYCADLTRESIHGGSNPSAGKALSVPSQKAARKQRCHLRKVCRSREYAPLIDVSKDHQTQLVVNTSHAVFIGGW